MFQDVPQIGTDGRGLVDGRIAQPADLARLVVIAHNAVKLVDAVEGGRGGGGCGLLVGGIQC